MAYELTWTFNHNEVPTDTASLTNANQAFHWRLKQLLVANGWVGVKGSNGTTFFASSDPWSSYSDVNHNSIFAGNSYSWIIMKSPVGTVPGLDGTGTGEQSRVYFGMSLPSTSGTLATYYFDIQNLAGGSTTTEPTTNSTTKTYLNNISVPSAAATISDIRFSFQFASNFTFRTFVTLIGNNAISATIHFNCLVDRVTLTNPAIVGGTPRVYPYPLNIRVTGYAAAGCDTLTILLSAVNNATWTYDGVLSTNDIYVLRTPSLVLGDSTTTAGNANAKNDQSPVYCANTTTAKTMLVGRIPDYFVTGATLGPVVVDDTVTPAWGFINTNQIGGAWVPTNVVFQV